MDQTKNLHLVCNAHIDPVWLWDLEEGISAALSTFRMAAFRKISGQEAYLLRLFESTGSAQTVRITLKQADGKRLEKAVEAGPFEVKTLRYEPKEGTLEECGIFG